MRLPRAKAGPQPVLPTRALPPRALLSEALPLAALSLMTPSRKGFLAAQGWHYGPVDSLLLLLTCFQTSSSPTKGKSKKVEKKKKAGGPCTVCGKTCKFM